MTQDTLTIRPDGWVRDHSGAWHPPGHPIPIRTTVTVRWGADWKGLAQVVWAWMRGRSATMTLDLAQTMCCSIRGEG